MNGEDIYNICKKDPDIKESFKAILTEKEVDVFISDRKLFYDWFQNVLHCDFPMSFILFSQEHDRRDQDSAAGTTAGHWQAVYFDVTGHCFFFDSYGFKPRIGFQHFCINMMSIAQHLFPKIRQKYTINNVCKEIQARDTNVCGEYCIYFLHVISTCKHPEQAQYVLDESFPKVITKGPHASRRDKFGNYAQFYVNDQFVKDWVENNYSYKGVKSIIPKAI